MELLDVVNDIETPVTSEDEDPEASIANPPRTPHIAQVLLNMLAAVSTLARDTNFSALYHDPNYLYKVSKKMKKMKKNAKRVDFETVYRDECFWHHLARIQRTYPDDGGRSFLNHLVALEGHLTTEYDSDSIYEDESEPEEPTKKLKFEKDDDDDYQGGQMISV
jgi:Fe2+ or Zn2+ uptake regulation protein